MARTPIQPSTATQPNTAAATPDIDARGPLDEQDQRSDNTDHRANADYRGNTEYGGNNERRESGLTSVRDDQRSDDRRSDDRRSDDHSDRENRDDRPFGEKRGFDQDSQRAPWATSGAEAYAPVLDAWKQVFQSWSELAETMVKVQQQSFATMMGATQATAKNLTSGERSDRQPALSGVRSDSPASGQIDNDRR